MAHLTSAQTSNRLLPEDYEPCDNTVIIGRGKQVHNHEGNLRYRDVLQENLHAYKIEAVSRSAKGGIIRKVIDEIRQKSRGGYGFVKQDNKTGHWIVLEDIAARTSVGQAFRDLMNGKVRSTRQSAQAQAQARRRSSAQVAPAVAPVVHPAARTITANPSSSSGSVAVAAAAAKPPGVVTTMNLPSLTMGNLNLDWANLNTNNMAAPSLANSPNSLQGLMAQGRMSLSPSPQELLLQTMPCSVGSSNCNTTNNGKNSHCDADAALVDRFLQMMPDHAPLGSNPFEPEPIAEVNFSTSSFDPKASFMYSWDPFFNMG